MEQLFLLGGVEALGLFVLTLFFGKAVKDLAVTVFLWLWIGPILVIFVSGAVGILGAQPGNATAVANATIDRIVSYFSQNITGIIISDLAGALVGAFGGFLVRARAANGS